MQISRQLFLRNYLTAIQYGHAALFIGAGMSRSAGFVDWSSLLRDIANEIGLNIESEHDLVAITQYYLNKRNRDRSRLNQLLKDEFEKVDCLSINHEIIGKLPISTIWTTNYDSLIETAVQKSGKCVDIKRKDSDFTLTRKGSDVVLYKMHGDVLNPENIVICRDDYEKYAIRHPLFQSKLKSDLVDKTFLFLGFSFSDPNLNYIFGHLRALLDDNKREHYAIMRKVRLNWNMPEKHAKAEYEYALNRQYLQIEDLKRYSIQTLLIDEWDHITLLLLSLVKEYFSRHIFVSGSAHQFGDFGEDRMRDLCLLFGERLIAEGIRLISGMGLNIGDSVVKGAIGKLCEIEKYPTEKNLIIRPFPRNLPRDVSAEDFNSKHREGMIKMCGFAVFIAGTSRTGPVSKGVIEEYRIVRKMGKIPIPIGATGFAARRVWEMVEKDFDEIFGESGPRDLYRKLNDDSLPNDKLIDTVFELINGMSEC